MKLDQLKNKIIQGDCLEIMKDIPDNSIDLVITSPPYDNLRDYKEYTFDYEKVADELFRIMAIDGGCGGIVVWIVGDATMSGDETGTSFRQALYFKKIGFRLHDTMIYQKEGLTMNHNRYEQEFEYMFIFSKGNVKTFNPIMVPCKWYDKDSDRTGQLYGKHNITKKKARSEKLRTNIKSHKIKGNIWKYNTGSGHSTKDRFAFEHPAIFPEQLAGDHIRSWSNEGDLILDPMNGSGTTTKMAKHLKRNFIGIDISEEYCEIARQRLRQDILI